MAQRTREIEITGIKEFRKMCNDFSPREARNLARSTAHGVAGRVRDEMRQKAPRDEGTLRKAIKTKRRRMQGDTAISDVRIEHGGRAKWDAFHWHYVEFGTLYHAEQPYIRPTVNEIEPRIPMIFQEEFGKKLQKALDRKAKAQGVR